MAEPPRLTAITIPSGTSIIYFVTLCVEGRRAVLTNPETFNAMEATISVLRNWSVMAGVVMPDHVHLLITPSKVRGTSVGDFATGFKKVLRKKLKGRDWKWQRGCFDRLLRCSDNAQQKWLYVEQNPVRAGLVKRVQDWLYYLGHIAEDPAGDGKVTPSPTEERETAGELRE